MFKRTIATAMILVATLCFTIKTDAAKSTQWLIYWYVCGTDIETTRIAFTSGTDLMSDDPNMLGLADPDKHPGDATRCINEVENAELSPDVKIFMQAGGTYLWGHKKFRDNNAKIATQIEMISTDAEGNPLTNEDGTYQKIQNNVITATNLQVNQWFLKNDVTWDENGNPQQTIIPAENGKVNRYLYDKYHRDWHPREQLIISGEKDTETDMGSQTGLVSFLQAGQQLEKSLYPEGNVRRVLIFVDHGQGCINHQNLGGVICGDEYTQNMLSLKEVRDAFAQVKDGWANPEEKPFEVIAFDACLMSTYETAQALKDTANYMVASQEEGNGKVMFGYTDLLNELSKNPAMSGAQLGRVICDAYWNDSKVTDKAFGFKSNEILTLSVVDLSENKVDALKTAYDNFGNAALSYLQQRPDELSRIFSNFNKSANRAERYPSEAAAKHFSDYQIAELADLKGFAKNSAQNIPELKQVGSELVSAVDNAVIYQKRGDSLKHGGGLSTFYPFNLLDSLTNINSYVALADDNLAPANQANLYAEIYNSVIGNLKQVAVPTLDSETGKELTDSETGEVITEMKWQIPVGSIFDISDFSEVEVQLDEENKTAWVELNENQLRRIENVRCQLISTENYRRQR